MGRKAGKKIKIRKDVRTRDLKRHTLLFRIKITIEYTFEKICA